MRFFYALENIIRMTYFHHIFLGGIWVKPKLTKILIKDKIFGAQKKFETKVLLFVAHPKEKGRLVGQSVGRLVG